MGQEAAVQTNEQKGLQEDAKDVADKLGAEAANIERFQAVNPFETKVTGALNELTLALLANFRELFDQVASYEKGEKSGKQVMRENRIKLAKSLVKMLPSSPSNIALPVTMLWKLTSLPGVLEVISDYKGQQERISDENRMANIQQKTLIDDCVEKSMKDFAEELVFLFQGQIAELTEQGIRDFVDGVIDRINDQLESERIACDSLNEILMKAFFDSDKDKKICTVGVHGTRRYWRLNELVKNVGLVKLPDNEDITQPKNPRNVMRIIELLHERSLSLVYTYVCHVFHIMINYENYIARCKPKNVEIKEKLLQLQKEELESHRTFEHINELFLLTKEILEETDEAKKDEIKNERSRFYDENFARFPPGDERKLSLVLEKGGSMSLHDSSAKFEFGNLLSPSGVGTWLGQEDMQLIVDFLVQLRRDWRNNNLRSSEWTIETFEKGVLKLSGLNAIVDRAQGRTKDILYSLLEVAIRVNEVRKLRATVNVAPDGRKAMVSAPEAPPVFEKNGYKDLHMQMPEAGTTLHDLSIQTPLAAGKDDDDEAPLKTTREYFHLSESERGASTHSAQAAQRFYDSQASNPQTLEKFAEGQSFLRMPLPAFVNLVYDYADLLAEELDTVVPSFDISISEDKTRIQAVSESFGNMLSHTSCFDPSVEKEQVFDLMEALLNARTEHPELLSLLELRADLVNRLNADLYIRRCNEKLYNETLEMQQMHINSCPVTKMIDQYYDLLDQTPVNDMCKEAGETTCRLQFAPSLVGKKRARIRATLRVEAEKQRVCFVNDIEERFLHECFNLLLFKRARFFIRVTEIDSSGDGRNLDLSGSKASSYGFRLSRGTELSGSAQYQEFSADALLLVRRAEAKGSFRTGKGFRRRLMFPREVCNWAGAPQASVEKPWRFCCCS